MQADVEPRFGGYACGVFSPGRFVSMEESTSAAAAAAGSWDGNPYLMPSVQLDHGLTSPLQTSLEMSTALSQLYAEYSTGSQGMYDAEAANLPTEPPWVANGAHSGLAAQSWPSMDENDQRQSFATPIPYPNDGKVQCPIPPGSFSQETQQAAPGCAGLQSNARPTAPRTSSYGYATPVYQQGQGVCATPEQSPQDLSPGATRHRGPGRRRSEDDGKRRGHARKRPSQIHAADANKLRRLSTAASLTSMPHAMVSPPAQRITPLSPPRRQSIDLHLRPSPSEILDYGSLAEATYPPRPIPQRNDSFTSLRSSSSSAATTSQFSPSPPSSYRQAELGSSQRARNRVAATKCRAKTKAAINHLEANSKLVSEQREVLSRRVAMLRDEVLALKTELLKHSRFDCILIQQYLSNAAAQIGQGAKEGAARRLQQDFD